MFCTDKERMTCQEEKMGCEGCYYYNDKNKPFVNRIINKYCKGLAKKLFKIPDKLPNFKYCIETSRIKVPQNFIDKPPKKGKMAQRWKYYRETGELYVPIVINNKGILIDGYTSYLIAVAESMKYVDVKLSEGRK